MGSLIKCEECNLTVAAADLMARNCEHLRARIHTLEGMVDSDAFTAMLMEPVMQLHPIDRWDLCELIEDIGIQLHEGDELSDESKTMNPLPARRYFDAAKQNYLDGKTCRDWWWKAVLFVHPYEEMERVFEVLEFEGDGRIRPEPLMRGAAGAAT